MKLFAAQTKSALFVEEERVIFDRSLNNVVVDDFDDAILNIVQQFDPKPMHDAIINHIDLADFDRYENDRYELYRELDAIEASFEKRPPIPENWFYVFTWGQVFKFPEGEWRNSSATMAWPCNGPCPDRFRTSYISRDHFKNFQI
jgi:hypothetical protein